MKIGVFDSGLGGLSVLLYLRAALPEASFCYIADSANAPYGDKSDDFIAERSLRISQFLIDQQVSAIVVACNTATAAAVQQIRHLAEVPVVAIEPALKPAAIHSKAGKIGVLATASTLNSVTYQGLMKRFSNDVDYYQQAAHGLVEQVESGEISQQKTLQLLEKYLKPMIEQGIDSLVLGCTHYPFLLNEIRQVVGDDIAIFDTGQAVSVQLVRVLGERPPEDISSEKKHSYFSSGNLSHAEKMIDYLMGEKVTVEKLSV